MEAEPNSQSSDSFTVTGTNTKAFRPMASLRNYYCYVGNKSVYGVYERPPFPIIIDVPTARDIVQNWQMSDFVMAGTIYGAGMVISYLVSRPFPLVSQKLLVYHGLTNLFLVNAYLSMWVVPYKRLTGFWENGLRWRQPEDKMRKYDNTSHYENATIWKRFRVL